MNYHKINKLLFKNYSCKKPIIKKFQNKKKVKNKY